MDRRELFPLYSRLKVASQGVKGSRSRKHHRKRRMKAEVVCAMTRALNGLAEGMIEDESASRNAIVGGDVIRRNSAQNIAENFLEEIAESAIRRNYFELDATNGGPFDYTGDTEHHRVWLDPEAVALPSSAGTAKVLDLLPAEVRSLYEKENSGLVIEYQSQVPHFFLGVRMNKYCDLIERLVDVGLVMLQNRKPKVENGVFAVPKDCDRQGLIIDARPANSYIEEPPKTKLPNPGDLALLHVDERNNIYFCKSDMDNCYYRLEMPEWLHQYFGLPPLVVDGETVWPVVKVLPMGWSHSVVISQCIHEELLKKAHLFAYSSFQHNKSRILNGFRHGEYIDDFFAVASNKEYLDNVFTEVLNICESVGLPSKIAKVVFPGRTDEITILGIMISNSGLVSPHPEKLVKLINTTRAIVSFRVWNVKSIERLIGCWTWVILLRRPLFSILFSIYSFLNTKTSQKVKTPSKSMRRELQIFCNVAPLIRSDIKRPFANICVATDASEKGAGVVYSNLKFFDWEQIEQGEDQTISVVKSKNWKLAIRRKRECSDHIHILEGHAVMLGLRWILRSKRFQGSWFVLLLDNTARLYALRKRRSSSFQLNVICRKVAAICLAGDLQVDYYYIRSQHNPADGASRSF